MNDVGLRCGQSASRGDVGGSIATQPKRALSRSTLTLELFTEKWAAPTNTTVVR